MCICPMYSTYTLWHTYPWDCSTLEMHPTSTLLLLPLLFPSGSSVIFFFAHWAYTDNETPCSYNILAPVTILSILPMSGISQDYTLNCTSTAISIQITNIASRPAIKISGRKRTLLPIFKKNVYIEIVTFLEPTTTFLSLALE